MTKWWFAPGPVPTEETIKIEYSHRSEEFSQMYLKTVSMLEEWTRRKIVLIQGSASAAIESVLEGMGLQHKRVLVVNNGSFSQRVVNRLNLVGYPVTTVANVVEAKKMVLLYGNRFAVVYVVQFETSNSTLNEVEELGHLCWQEGLKFVVDAVSAFPYYKFPERADVVVLSSSKQLRGLPVLGIVAYKQEMESEFGTTHGYLDLKKAIEYGKKGQTPHTSLIPQIQSLWNSLDKALWISGVGEIGNNAVVVGDAFEDILIGEYRAPVLTFQTVDVEKLLAFLKERDLEVYWNPAYSGQQFQVSCFNYPYQEPYELLNEALLDAREKGYLGNESRMRIERGS